MVPVIMDIMVTGRGFQVTGVGDGRTTGGEESGTGDIGGTTTVKSNFSRLTPGSSPGSTGWCTEIWMKPRVLNN
jgi:hypothetical protein